jgi:hypothetical protein
MIHWTWLLVAFTAGGWIAHSIIKRELLRRLADGRLVEVLPKGVVRE